MPEQPVHPNCHCTKKALSDFTAEAECARDKFESYALKFREIDDKSGLFLQYGYDILYTDWLMQEYIRQAKEKYADGEYALAAKPTENGQKIKISIELPDRIQSGTVAFITIWMVEPGGKIRLVTPFSGHGRIE